jgi:hypothetical protein
MEAHPTEGTCAKGPIDSARGSHLHPAGAAGIFAQALDLFAVPLSPWRKLAIKVLEEEGWWRSA